MFITLRNRFHGTACRVRIKRPDFGPDGELSAHQTRRVKRVLCGVTDCQCGGIYGKQTDDQGRKLIVDYACDQYGDRFMVYYAD